MSAEGTDFAETLAEAQERGYAEADPSLDINGGDSAHKLAILSSIAFGQEIFLRDILIEEGCILQKERISYPYSCKGASQYQLAHITR